MKNKKYIKLLLLCIAILFVAEIGYYFIKGTFFPFTNN